jgi:UDP-2-acetamido-3-amino-2,3-dideoxy-glucuronate N-acetyltransferase
MPLKAATAAADRLQVKLEQVSDPSAGARAHDAVIEPGCILDAQDGTNHDAPPTRVCSEAFVGAGAIILRGVTIGRGALVRPGSVVTNDVPPMTIVSGNPARIDGYLGIPASPSTTSDRVAAAVGKLTVPGVEVHRLTYVSDLRGALTALEHAYLPFTPRRTFVVSQVPSEELRGQHAHISLHQFLVCLAGSVSVMVDDGHFRDEVRLVSSDVGLHIPPMVWGVQYRYSSDAVLLVLASAEYDDADYIRDYDEFLVRVHGSP